MSVELPITGYVDRLSRRPGEAVNVHVSAREAGLFRARLVRVISADPNPDGPGMSFEPLPQHLDATYEGQHHPVRLGSCGIAPGPVVDQAETNSWTALIWPSILSGDAQAVLSHEADDCRLSLYLSEGRLRAEVSSDTGTAEFDLNARILTHRWYRVWISCNPVADTVTLGLHSVSEEGSSPTVEHFVRPGLRLPSGGQLLIAARHLNSPKECFEGKIEDPAVLRGTYAVLDDPRISLAQLAPNLLAGWDFAKDIASQTIHDVGPHQLHGALRNVPTRAVRGSRWTGDEMCWQHRPDHYAAIHFHSDDLGDCAWPVTFSFLVPTDLGSGSYAIHLTCDDGEDWIPFYVLPSLSGPRAPIAFLAPTFTYQAYGNHAFGNYDDAMRARVAEWGAYPYHPQDYRTYGVSTYNVHPDGSGVAFASRLRPMLTMRPGFLKVHDSKGSGLLHYPADAHLLAWLEACGFAFDVVTDEDLHEEGVELLAPYAAVLTGTHPEYHTSQTLDALRDYVAGGGNLAYLGGNGFYWRVGCNEALPGMIEVRRAEGGTRAWASAPGEYYHATDGAYGGLWRRNGRDPQALVGIGFSAQGDFEATYYRRTGASHDPAVSWIFDGVEGEIIGDYGLNAGGAAGFEIDRADVALGTPLDAVVLASTEAVPASFGVTLEEMAFSTYTLNGEPAQSLVRADMVYFENNAGGAVFSVGSMTYGGSLWRDGFHGPISRITENVVRRFAKE